LPGSTRSTKAPAAKAPGLFHDPAQTIAARADPRSPFNDHDCESCHGASPEHLRDEKLPVAVVFDGTTAAVATSGIDIQNDEPGTEQTGAACRVRRLSCGKTQPAAVALAPSGARRSDDLQ